ncbi:LysE family translocator [Vibrio parahaemolyticus]|nr:LysE family translocator [Vibrio parahaemolyticus]EHR1137030.1 LysE family translocator [Vibrio parahaemolyticus]EKG2489456.1 LysE family translocator [Vibrio parahaemolyticus]
MSFEVWVMFTLAYLVVTLSPGPNVLLVLKNSVQYGWKSALVTILGNLFCQLIIVSLVAIGVGGLLSQLPAWFFVMKCAGGLYLIYLGLKSFKSIRTNTLQQPKMELKPVAFPSRSLFKQAFFVSVSNPKTLIFLSAFLPQFLDTNHSHIEQFAVMYISICLIVTSVHFGYALIVSRIGQKLRATNFENKLAKITGGLFITMGGGVLFSSRA